MRRSLVVLGIALVAALSLASPSSASEPIITRSGPFEVVIPFPDICAFPLTATLSGNTHSLTFVDAAGNPTRGFAGGQLFVTWARDDTGASRTFAITGPAFFDATGNAIRGTGRWVTLLEGTGLVLASGNLTLDELQAITAMNGHASSICDLMS